MKMAHFDLVFGCIVTALITSAIVVCSATNLFPLGITVSSASDMAAQLTPILGRYAGILFSLGLWAAAFSSGLFRIELLPMLYNQATDQEEDMKAPRSPSLDDPRCRYSPDFHLPIRSLPRGTGHHGPGLERSVAAYYLRHYLENHLG